MCAQSIETFQQNFSQLKKNHLFLKQAPNAPTSIKPAIQLGPYFHPFFMKQITFSTQDIFVKVISLLHERTGFLYVLKSGYAHGASRGGMFGGIRGDETMVIQAPGDQLLFPCTGAQVLCISYVVINKCRKVRSPLHNLCTPALPAEVTVRDAQEQGDPR